MKKYICQCQVTFLGSKTKERQASENCDWFIPDREKNLIPNTEVMTVFPVTGFKEQCGRGYCPFSHFFKKQYTS